MSWPATVAAEGTTDLTRRKTAIAIAHHEGGRQARRPVQRPREKTKPPRTLAGVAGLFRESPPPQLLQSAGFVRGFASCNDRCIAATPFEKCGWSTHPRPPGECAPATTRLPGKLGGRESGQRASMHHRFDVKRLRKQIEQMRLLDAITGRRPRGRDPGPASPDRTRRNGCVALRVPPESVSPLCRPRCGEGPGRPSQDVCAPAGFSGIPRFACQPLSRSQAHSGCRSGKEVCDDSTAKM